MKLKLYKTKENYTFSVDGFASTYHYFLTSGCQNEYKYAWEAYKDAINLGKKQKYHIEAIANKRYAAEDLTKPVTIDISAEEMMMDHYLSIFNILSKKTNGLGEKNKQKDKREIVYGEIKAIVDEILKVEEKVEEASVKKDLDDLISKFKHLVSANFHDLLMKDIDEIANQEKQSQQSPVAQVPQAQQPQEPSLEEQATQAITSTAKTSFVKQAEFNKNNQDELLEDYGCKICKTLEKKHSNAIFKVNYENRFIDIVEADSGDLLLKIGFDNTMNLDKIVPFGKLESVFPINSVEFYQRYWKPVVEAVGHFFVKSASVILSTNEISLPDIPNKCPFYCNLKGIETTSKKAKSVTLWFKGGNPTWDFEKNAHVKTQDGKEYTEEDFVNGSPKIVKCIDPKLKTIYQKTGEVVQVIPLESHIEIDVDFGRTIIRLTEHQVEIINEL
jgi:hypothetical protein